MNKIVSPAPAGRRGDSRSLRAIAWVILAAYLVLLIKVVLLKYQGVGEFVDGLLGDGHGWRSANLLPFRSIASYLASGVDGWRKAGNILGNIGVFVPLGVLLPALLRSRRRMLVTLALGLALSVVLEALQWFGYAGVADIDDAILNLTGTGLGLGVYALLRRRFAGRPRAVLSMAMAVVLAVGVAGTVVALRSFSSDLGVEAGSSDKGIGVEEVVSSPLPEGVPDGRPDLVGTVTAAGVEQIRLIENEVVFWEEDQVAIGKGGEEGAAELTVEFAPEAKFFRLVYGGGEAYYEPATAGQIPKGAFVELWGKQSAGGFVAETILYSEPT